MNANTNVNSFPVYYSSTRVSIQKDGGTVRRKTKAKGMKLISLGGLEPESSCRYVISHLATTLLSNGLADFNCGH